MKAIVTMGKDNSKILEFFGPEVETIRDTHSLDEAIEACHSLASAGDTVLLSPCCASFDLFKSYEDRGRQFKDAVKKLFRKTVTIADTIPLSTTMNDTIQQQPQSLRSKTADRPSHLGNLYIPL